MASEDMLIMVPTYNDIEALTRLLDTAHEQNTKVLVMDGRFIDFPQINGSDLSTDGTKELTEKTGNYYMPFDPCLEQDKYTAGLKFGHSKGYRYVMWMASDEYLQGSMDTFVKILDRFSITEPRIILVNYEEHNLNSKYAHDFKTQPRVHVNYKDIYYKNVHWHAYIGDRRIKADGRVGGIIIHHDDRIRPKKRDEMMDDYADILVEKEKKWL
jgi:hypothetical protein